MRSNFGSFAFVLAPMPWKDPIFQPASWRTGRRCLVASILSGTGFDRRAARVMRTSASHTLIHPSSFGAADRCSKLPGQRLNWIHNNRILSHCLLLEPCRHCSKSFRNVVAGQDLIVLPAYAMALAMLVKRVRHQQAVGCSCRPLKVRSIPSRGGGHLTCRTFHV